MSQNRSLLFHGLSLTLRRFPAVLWAYAFNLAFALLATLRIARAVGAVTNHSLAARPLDHGFDLGTMGGLMLKLSGGPGLHLSVTATVILYLATYFLLVPGTLLCYQTGVPARLSTLLQAGLLHFWRFVRILILSLIVYAIVLGPLLMLQNRWMQHVMDHVVGLSALLHNLAGWLIVALVAALLRVYFDLVEVYTVQVGLEMRPDGRPDRRVRRALLPAARALGRSFWRMYPIFLLLALLGFAAMFLLGRVAVHSLAQPRVWPMFLLAQAGLFLMLLARFWQRGAETTLSLNRPVVPIEEEPVPARASFLSVTPPAPSVVPIAEPVEEELHGAGREMALEKGHVEDPIPDPEPASPSLAGPDPQVYHAEPIPEPIPAPTTEQEQPEAARPIDPGLEPPEEKA